MQPGEGNRPRATPRADVYVPGPLLETPVGPENRCSSQARISSSTMRYIHGYIKPGEEPRTTYSKLKVAWPILNSRPCSTSRAASRTAAFRHGSLYARSWTAHRRIARRIGHRVPDHHYHTGTGAWSCPLSGGRSSHSTQRRTELVDTDVSVRVTQRAAASERVTSGTHGS